MTLSGCNLLITFIDGLNEPSINVTPRNASVEIYQYIYFHAEWIDPGEDIRMDITNSASWSVSRPEIATISYNGEVYAWSAGTIEVYARYEGKTGKATLSIYDPAGSTPDPDPTPDPSAPNPPCIYNGMGDYVNYDTPTWTWSSGGGGNGTYRLKIDDSNLEWDAYEISDTYFSAPSSLSDGIHYFYIQERNGSGIWSETSYNYLIIDTVPPDVDAGYDRTTGSGFELAGNGNDANGIAGFEWHQMSGPGTLDFSDPYAQTTYVTASYDGWYDIEFAVYDYAGNWSYDYTTIVVESTAQAFYPFNGNPYDESGWGRDGQLVGSPPCVTDRNGNPCSAYDVSSDYIKVSDGVHPDIYEGFTIAGWVRRTISGTHAYQCFLGKDYTKMYGIGVRCDTGKFYIKVGTETLWFSDAGHPVLPVDSMWHHFAVTYKDTTDLVELYFDGVFAASMPCTASMTPSTSPLGIGRDGNYMDSFEGDIDDVYIFDRVLDSAYIEDIYQRP